MANGPVLEGELLMAPKGGMGGMGRPNTSAGALKPLPPAQATAWAASAASGQRDGEAEDGQGEPDFKALTPDQAAALRARMPLVSPWRVVGLQAGVGLVIAIAMLLLTSPLIWVGSFLYGTAAVVLPGALMAWGISKPRSGRAPGAGLTSFMLWEAAKVGLSVLMLLLAPLLMPGVTWLALLAGMVVCLKCYWAALVWRGSKKN